MKNTYLTFGFMLIYSSVHAVPLPMQTIKSYDCDRCSHLSHELLKDSWALSNQQLNTLSTNQQKSYSYRQKISAQELQKGVPLSLLAPGAVIRISPINTASTPSLNLQTPNHKTMTLHEASSLYIAKPVYLPV